MEPPIRCKFFDDDGIPIPPGCRFRSKCRFVHPNDPSWSAIMPYRPPRARPSPPPHSRRLPDDRAPPTRRTSYTDTTTKEPTSWGQDSSWADDDSGWGQAWGQSTSKAQSNVNSSSDHDSGWGQPWGQSTNTNTSSDHGSGWGQATTKAINSSSDPWGQSTLKAQSNVQPPSDRDSGWGQGTTKTQSNINSSSDHDSGWSAWGQSTTKAQNNVNASSDHDSGWGQSTSKAQSNVNASSDHDSGWGPSTSKAQSQQPLASRASTDSPSVLHASPAMSRLKTQDHEREPPKTDVNQASKEIKRPVLLTKLQQRSLDYNPSSPIVPLRLLSLLPRRAEEISSPLIPTASQTPKELHENLIRELVDAVIIRSQLLKVEDKKMKWRAARQSSCYYHSAPAARDILDRNYQEYIETIGTLTRQLNSSLKRVVQYSDALNTHKEKLTKGLNSQNIMSYTSDLRDWIVNVDLPRRLGNTKAFIKRNQDETAAIKQRRKEEMDGLRNDMEELELKATDIWDDLSRLDTALPERFNEEFTVAKDAMKKDDTDPNLNQEMLANMGIGKEDIDAVKTRNEILDRTVGDFTAKSQELQARIKSLEDQVAELRQKDAEINEFRRDAHDRLRQMDSWRSEDVQKMDQISLIIENLNMSSHSATPPTANAVDLVVPCIQELVMQYIAEEVKPVLDAIAEACEKGNQRARADLDKLLERIVTKTYDLVQMALKANGLFPQIVPRSQ